MSLGSANYIAGKTGFITLAGNHYRFGKWSFPIKTKMVPVTNFESAGFQEMLACINSATITASGPYDAGNMPLTCGATYSVVLAWTNALSLTVTALIESLEPDNDAEGNATIKISMVSNGSFGLSVT